MLGGWYNTPYLLYDVSDPLHPVLICTISNTSAHLFTGDTFVYLKPVTANETDIMLHSIGSGNESKAGSFPTNISYGAWSPTGSVLAYTTADEVNNKISVWLYAGGTTKLIHSYGQPIGDCICRFGLPPAVLSFSPDGQYLAAGWLAGKGSTPMTVIRLSDGGTVLSADTNVYAAIWDRTGHRLYLTGFNSYGTYSWTPEGGLVKLGNPWRFMAGLSPDGTAAAYTDYIDPNQAQPRAYVFDIKTAQARTLVNQMRTQVLFVKDGWVWYLEERSCTQNDNCAGATIPTGKVFAMQLSTGVEQPVTFAAGQDWSTATGGNFWSFYSPGEFWPAS
jgi:hypothetical protein